RRFREIPGVGRTTMRAATAGASPCARSARTARPAVTVTRQTSSAMRADRGFTLLETLLALAIGGLLPTAAYAAVVRAAAARDASLQRTGDVVGARRALLEMARTLETSAGQRFGADAHTVHVVQPEPEPRLVRYALDGSRLVESTESAFAAPG